MPPRKSVSASVADNTTAVSITDGEMNFIKALFDNMKERPDADWDKVAAAAELKNAKCAKERFRQMSVKHGWRLNSGDGTPKKGSTPTKVSKIRTPKSNKKTPRAKTPVADDPVAEDNVIDDTLTKDQDDNSLLSEPPMSPKLDTPEFDEGEI
jgi:hypothetical protein